MGLLTELGYFVKNWVVGKTKVATKYIDEYAGFLRHADDDA